jgi:3-deoxy-D-manno-octulosonic-acid transferase
MPSVPRRNGVSALLSLYAAVTRLLEPFAPVALARRARRGKEDPVRLGERLGRATIRRPEGPLVWLHGVSVGESLSLLPLVSALRARRPDLALLVTSGTRTSADLLAKRLPAGVIHQYAPVDAPGPVNRFLDHWRPVAGVFVESELWPNLIRGARRRGVRLALVSARMTQASAQGWSRAGGAAKTLLGAFDLILPQESLTAARLTALGAKVGPNLNLKRIGDPLPCDEAELALLRAAVAGRTVILASNTHEGEETIIAEAARGVDALLLLAIRHPDRGPAVAADLTARGFKVARRSAGEPIASDTAAYVADTVGEMGLFYRLADVAVMGGSFVDGIGGHNPLEPARLGVPVITGPHMFNAAELYDEMFAEVAAIEAIDGAALARHLKGLDAFPHIRRRIAEAGLDYAARQGAALDAALGLIEPLLPA